MLDTERSEQILTERLMLRIYTSEVVVQLLRNENDETIKNTFCITSDNDLERYKARLTVSNNYCNFRLFILYDKHTSSFLGSCNYHSWIPFHRRAEIGYIINEPHRNKGYAKEAMRAVLTHGFKEMQLNRVEAFISPVNIPSLRVAAHFGFTKEGLMRENYCVNGLMEDSVCFSLLRKEYETKSAQ